MLVNKLKNKWQPISSVNRSGRKYGIYSVEEFQKWILYERERSDRKKSIFSLVIYSLCGADKKRNISRECVELLKDNIRSTDHIGWYENNKIGVLLPETDKSGAVIFAKNMTVQNSSLQAEHIYTYPDYWFEHTKEKAGAENDESNPNVLEFTKSVSEEAVFVVKTPKWKRALDIAGSLFGLVICSPLFAIISLYIKIVSPGPVFYKQKRVGQGRKEFTFIKFRSMHYNNNETVHTHHAKDFINYDKPMDKLDEKDPRIYFGGKVLRKSCIDELPQLINILKGEMSLVGPRPCIPYEADEYERWHTRRFSILPGLTGLWQVSGKNKLTFKQMIKLDITYEKNMSLFLDLKIILLTIPTVFSLVLEAVIKKLPAGRQKKNDNFDYSYNRKQLAVLSTHGEESRKSIVDNYEENFLLSK
jgi:lipopolysaccharide/colanic/teichoic acid biosynthesis glycosyltransferase